MNTLLSMATGVAMTLVAGPALAADYYYANDCYTSQVAYYKTVVRYHSVPVLAGYQTFVKTYTVPVVSYRTYVRYHTVPIYRNLVYRTVHHYPVYEDYISYEPYHIYVDGVVD